MTNEIQAFIEQQIRDHQHNGVTASLSQFAKLFGTIETVTSAPSGSPKDIYGQVKIYNSNLYVYDVRNATWINFGAGAGSGDVVGPASSVDGQAVLFSGTTGKLLKAATGSGVAHVASGVLSASNVVESEITLADNTTNNVTISSHGFTPKAPNDTTKFLRGDASWAVPGGSGTPGGSDSHVQYNDGGVFGGDSLFAWNDGTKVLSVPELDLPDAGGILYSEGSANNFTIATDSGTKPITVNPRGILTLSSQNDDVYAGKKSGALATSAAVGFSVYPPVLGLPTGTPTSSANGLALVYDSTNNKLYIYNGGWKSVTLS